MNNSTYLKEYYKKNRDKILSQQKIYYENNRKKIIDYVSEYYRDHLDEKKEYDYLYKRNPENKKRRNLREKERKQQDPIIRIINNLRSRLWKALKRNTKSGSAVRDLGCSIKDLKFWLEQQFYPGMTWDNYGKEWHIDHIIPLQAEGIDLTDRKHLKKVCHWFNLRPLWGKENLSRGNRI